MKEDNIILAILKLAELIDRIEDIPYDMQQKKQFRTRHQLIYDILRDKEIKGRQ